MKPSSFLFSRFGAVLFLLALGVGSLDSADDSTYDGKTLDAWAGLLKKHKDPLMRIDAAHAASRGTDQGIGAGLAAASQG